MVRKILFIAIVFCSSCFVSGKNYIQMANSEMKRNPESWMPDFRKTLKWDYTHGLELQAFWQVYEKTGNLIYLDYVKSFF